MISNASPTAFFSSRLIRTMSSSEKDPQRKATAEPTFPAPIIEIIYSYEYASYLLFASSLSIGITWTT